MLEKARETRNPPRPDFHDKKNKQKKQVIFRFSQGYKAKIQQKYK